MKLVSEGKLNLDAPVSDYIPEAAHLTVNTLTEELFPRRTL